MEKPNLNYINDLAGDDADFRTKLVGVIKTELPTEIAEYTTSISQNDYPKAVAHVHKLKHKISVMGMEEGYHLAESYEQELKENKTGLAPKFNEVLTLMQEFATAL